MTIRCGNEEVIGDLDKSPFRWSDGGESQIRVSSGEMGGKNLETENGTVAKEK